MKNHPRIILKTSDEYILEDEEESYDEVDELGVRWINGECSERFKVLNNLERLILKLYYMDNYSDREIGDLYGYHINTIFTKRKNAAKKIRDNP